MKGSLADLGTRRAVRHSHQLIRKCHTPGSTFHVARYGPVCMACQPCSDTFSDRRYPHRSRMCIATQASADDSQWWSSMSKRTPQGPVPAMPPPPPSSIEEINKEIMGERGYARYERVKRDERQRGERCGCACQCQHSSCTYLHLQIDERAVHRQHGVTSTSSHAATGLPLISRSSHLTSAALADHSMHDHQHHSITLSAMHRS